MLQYFLAGTVVHYGHDPQGARPPQSDRENLERDDSIEQNGTYYVATVSPAARRRGEATIRGD